MEGSVGIGRYVFRPPAATLSVRPLQLGETPRNSAASLMVRNSSSLAMNIPPQRGTPETRGSQPYQMTLESRSVPGQPDLPVVELDFHAFDGRHALPSLGHCRRAMVAGVFEASTGFRARSPDLAG